MSLLLLYDKLENLDIIKSKIVCDHRIICSFNNINSVDEYLTNNPINNLKKLYIVNNKIFDNDEIMNHFIHCISDNNIQEININDVNGISNTFNLNNGCKVLFNNWKNLNSLNISLYNNKIKNYNTTNPLKNFMKKLLNKSDKKPITKPVIEPIEKPLIEPVEKPITEPIISAQSDTSLIKPLAIPSPINIDPTQGSYTISSGGVYIIDVPTGNFPNNFQIVINVTGTTTVSISANKTINLNNANEYNGLIKLSGANDQLFLNIENITVMVSGTNSSLATTINQDNYNNYINGWILVGGSNITNLTMDNCHVSGTGLENIIVNNLISKTAIGGLCGGDLYGSNILFNNCSYTGNISVTTNTNQVISVGGICGGLLNGSKIQFKKCSFNGDISSEGTFIVAIGGICGGLNNCVGNPKDITLYGLQFDACDFNGNINNDKNNISHANGGICGGYNNYLPECNVNFINCSSKGGTIDSSKKSTNGGICGGFNCSIINLGSSTDNPNNSTMLFLNCSNTNPIKGTDSFNGGICGGNNINGLYEDGSPTNQIALGSVFFINCITVGNINDIMVNGNSIDNSLPIATCNGGICGGSNMCYNLLGIPDPINSNLKLINCQFIGTINGTLSNNGGLLGGGNFRDNASSVSYNIMIDNCSNWCNLLEPSFDNNNLENNTFNGGICGGKNSVFKNPSISYTPKNNVNILYTSSILEKTAYSSSVFNSGIVPLTIVNSAVLSPDTIHITNSFINWNDNSSPTSSQFYINFPDTLNWSDPSYVSTDLSSGNATTSGEVTTSFGTFYSSPYLYTDCNQIYQATSSDYKLRYLYEDINKLLEPTLTSGLTITDENSELIWEYTNDNYLLSSYYKNNTRNSYNLLNATEVLKSTSITKSIKKFFTNVIDLLSGNNSSPSSYSGFIDYYYQQTIDLNLSTTDNFFTILNNYLNAGSTTTTSLLNLVLSVTSGTLSFVKNKLKKAYIKVMPNNNELLEYSPKSIKDIPSIDEGQDDPEYISSLDEKYIKALFELFEKNKIKIQQKETFIQVVETPANLHIINIVKNIKDIFSKYSNQKKIYESYKEPSNNKNIRRPYKVIYTSPIKENNTSSNIKPVYKINRQYIPLTNLENNVSENSIVKPVYKFNRRYITTKYINSIKNNIQNFITTIITKPQSGIRNIKSLYSYRRSVISNIIETIKEIIKPQSGIRNIKSLYSYRRAVISDIIETIKEIIKPQSGIRNIKSLYSYRRATISNIIETIKEIIKPQSGIRNIKSLYSYRKATISDLIETIKETIKTQSGIRNIRSLYSYRKAVISDIIETIKETIKTQSGIRNIKSLYLYNKNRAYKETPIIIEPIIYIPIIRNDFNYTKLYYAYKYSYTPYNPYNPYKEYKEERKQSINTYKYLAKRYAPIIKTKDIIEYKIIPEIIEIIETPIIIISKPKIIILVDKPQKTITKDIKHKNIKIETKITRITRK